MKEDIGQDFLKACNDSVKAMKTLKEAFQKLGADCMKSQPENKKAFYDFGRNRKTHSA
jgi:hypothetical protein